MQQLTRREQQLATRQRLKASGARAMARSGCRGTRIEQVARDAGLTKGAFYAHFDDKLAMTLEILSDRQAADFAYWEAMLDAASDHDACLDDVIRHSGDAARINGLIAVELHLEAERNEAFRPHFMAYLEKLHAEVGRLLCKVLRRNGKAPPENLRELVAEMYILGTSTGVTSFFGDDMSPEELTGKFIRALVARIISQAKPLGAEQEAEGYPGA